jgi:hypothetical protein
MCAGLSRASRPASRKGSGYDCIKGPGGRGVCDEGGENGTRSKGTEQNYHPLEPIRCSNLSLSSLSEWSHTLSTFEGRIPLKSSSAARPCRERISPEIIPPHAATSGGHGVQHVHDAQTRGVEPSLPIRMQHLRVGMAMPFVCRQWGLQIGRASPSRLQGHVVCSVSTPRPRHIFP